MPREAVVCLLLVLTACSSSDEDAAASGTAGSGAGPAACTPASWPPVLGEPQLLAGELTRVTGSELLSADCAAPLSAPGAQPLDHAEGHVGPGFESMYAPSLPLFAEDDSTFVLPARIVHIEPDGSRTDFHVFDDPASAYASGFTGPATVGDQDGRVARGLQMAVLAEEDGSLLVAQSIAGTVERIDAAGTRTPVAEIPGVLSLSRGPDGAAYAVSAPRFDATSALTDPPIVYRIDAGGSASEHLVLPARYNYATGFNRDDGQGGYVPIGYMVDLAFDGDGRLHATLNLAGVVLREGDAGLEEIATGVAGVSGIALDPSGGLFVTRAPTARSGGAITGPAILSIDEDGTVATFYEGPPRDEYATGFISEGGYPIDAVFNLNLDEAGNVYLEDNLANEILLLPRD